MSFSLIGRMIARRAGATPKDLGFPLWNAKAGELSRARVGGVLDFSGAAGTFVMAEAGGSLMTPPQPSVAIGGYGRIRDDVFTIHRFYMAEHFLQVVAGRDGLVVAKEIKLFQKLAEVNPSTPQEWDLWIKGVDGNQPLLTGPSVQWQSTEFTRVWSPGNGAAEARQYVESLDVGQADPTLPVTTIKTMLFSRPLGSAATEWLQLSMCRSNGERWIEAYVGLSLEPGELSAI